MKKKKKRIKKKNGVAKALQHPSFKQQVVPDKRKLARMKALDELTALSQELGLDD